MIILASQSPRRLELLRLLGWDFEVKPAQTDESLLPGEAPDAYVLRLAQAKARAVLPLAPGDAYLIGADTSVVDQDEVLGKPATPDEAVQMLRKLRSRAHQVYSAVAVLRAADGKMLTDLCMTEVPMRNYSEAEIQAYVASGDPMDKAGAYGIQNADFRPVDHLTGCFASVMGLPLCHLTRTLRRLGIPPSTEVPALCQEMIQYDCPVFEDVLRSENIV